MRTSTELGDFLRSRRARVSPEEHGLRSHNQRRVPGLRREELAQLAGVSVSYYTRIEQGQTNAASRPVLEAIARVLGLNDDERAHLTRLAATDASPPRPNPPERIRPALRTLVTTLNLPAAVVGRSMDVLAWNPICHSLIFSHLQLDAPNSPATRPNWARMMFLDPHVHDLFVEWDTKQRDVVSYLRFQATQHPHDRRIADIVGELCVESAVFAREWARIDVKDKRPSTVRMRHPLVGELELHNETLRSPEAPDQMFATFHAEPGSSSEAALQLLADALHSQDATARQPRTSFAELDARRPS